MSRKQSQGVLGYCKKKPSLRPQECDLVSRSTAAEAPLFGKATGTRIRACIPSFYWKGVRPLHLLVRSERPCQMQSKSRAMGSHRWVHSCVIIITTVTEG